MRESDHEAKEAQTMSTTLCKPLSHRFVHLFTKTQDDGDLRIDREVSQCDLCGKRSVEQRFYRRSTGTMEK